MIYRKSGINDIRTLAWALIGVLFMVLTHQDHIII